MFRWSATPGKTEILIQVANEILADVRQSLEDDARNLDADIFVSEEEGTTTFVLQFNNSEAAERYAEQLAAIYPREGGVEVISRGRIN